MQSEALAKKAADAVGVTPYSDMRPFVEQAVKWALNEAALSKDAAPVKTAPAVAVKALETIRNELKVDTTNGKPGSISYELGALHRIVAVADAALSAQEHDVAGWQDEEKLTPEQAWTILCETPDITSPEEYPAHALITFEQLKSYMERAIAAEGWQLVPTEPTQEMLQRGADSCCSLTVHGAHGVYRSMLSASPASKHGDAE